MKQVDLKNAVIFITGANRGIGKAFVEEFIRKGVKKVYASARDVDSLGSVLALSPKKVIAVELDVTKEEQIQNAVLKCGDTNILVNNAGKADYAPLISSEDIVSARSEMEVNYFGLLNMVRAFSPMLKRNEGGAVINISSVAGLVGVPMLGSYAASKAAVHSLTQSLRGELSLQGTFVMGVYPGPVDTDMSKHVDMEKTHPLQIASYVIEALQKGEEDVFPEKVSQELIRGLKVDSKAVEKEWAKMMP